MAAILDFTQFTFSAEEIRAVKELLWDEVVKAPEIELIHTVFDGIQYDKEIGFIGKGGLVGVAQQTGDSDPVAQAFAIATRKIKWEPKGWEILIHQKRVDIEATAAVYSMKTGTSYNDFTSSDYMAIILEALAVSVKEFMIRLFWFNDTAIDNIVIEDLPTAEATEQTTGQAIVGTVYMGVVSTTSGAVKCALANGTVVYLAAAAATGNAVADKVYYTKDTVITIRIYSGGDLTVGVDKKYFNILNGFFKQMLTQVGVNPSQKVAIAENAGSTYSGQALSPTNVRDTYLPAILFNADMNLRGMANGFIICTQSFYDAYQKSLQGITAGVEALYMNLLNGQKTLSYNGIPLIPIPIWDVIIKTYYNNGAKWLNPHRAVYTSKELLAIGSDSIRSFGDLDVWYHKDSRKVKIEGMGKADAKLLNPALFQLAI